MAQNMKPIAVVGMSCRLPGDVSTLDEFWTLMARARNGWCEIPEDRFSKDAYWHPNPGKHGCFNSVGGYFLKHDISKFDAPFFNITRAEAQAMDPQQRQLLECTYEAMESAGIPKEAIAGKNMAVFVGASPSDYHLSSLRDLDTVPMFDSTGNHQSILAGRIAHFFDLKGPCLSVDTACSSGLHAVHLAVQSIRLGETEQAVVASSRLNLAPDHVASMSTNRLLSEHGVTHAFDHRAKSGFARGEGTGCLILKPLSRAIEDNDKIWSVIVNTGINHDGRTVGITSPNAKAQEELIREVYANAAISPNDCGFVEAHGTGTKVGDPIEATAIHQVFGDGLKPGKPLYVGSVKSNIGHLEPTSGIVSIIKASMMLDRGFILPNANFEHGNEAIPFAKWNLKVPTRIRPWPKDKRFISINNFGFGGSNAHCVLEKFPSTLQGTLPPAPTAMRLFVLSANDEESAQQRATQLGVYLEQHPGVFEKHLVRNIAYTLCRRRSHLPWRSAMVGSTSVELTQRLNSSDVKPARILRNPKIAFVFTGQGAQWHAMGRELMSSHDVFARVMNKADDTLRQLGASFSLVEELSRSKEDTQVNDAYFSQPVCTAVQVALVALLQSWGIRPSSVVGHSSGEIGAAYAAGALSFEDALSVAFNRGKAVSQMLADKTRVHGAMLAVGAGKETVAPMINMLRNASCAVACENAPNSVTVSGDTSSIDELAAKLTHLTVFNRKLKVEVAYHSRHMEAVAGHYLDAITGLSATSSDVPFYSSLKGRILESTSELNAAYWVDNLTRPVLFSTALQELCKTSEPDVLIEIGPHAALEGPIKSVLKSIGDKAKEITYLPSLKRNENATRTMLTVAGNLFKKGSTLDFARVNPDMLDPKPSHISNFAPYPWSGQRYWRESRVSRQHRMKPFPRHDLLGLMGSLSSDLEPSWRNVIRLDDIPWLCDHRMQELIAFPFSAFVSMGVEAAAQLASMRGVDFDRFNVREMQVTRPLLLQQDEEYELITNLRRYSEGTRSYSDRWDEFRVHSYHEDRGWTEHCRGLIGVSKNKEVNEVCKTSLPINAFYSELRERGVGYGPILQNILNISACDEFESGIGEVVVPDTASTMPEKYETSTVINAAFLDLLFQHIFVILGAGRGVMPCLYMPSAAKEIQIQRTIPSEAGEPFEVYVNGKADLSMPKTTEVLIQALNYRNPQEPAVVVKGFEVSPVLDDDLGTMGSKKLGYKTLWVPLGSEEDPAAESAVAEAGKVMASGTRNGDVEQLNAVSMKKDDQRNKTPASKGHDSNRVTANSDAAGGVPTEQIAEKRLWRDASSITLLTERTESDPLVSALTRNIELRAGRPPTVWSLDKASAVSGLCINLYELDNCMLAQMTAGTFDKMQQFLLDSTMVLWVTSGAYKNAKNPHRSMAQGLARTIRSETGRHIATLDLDASARTSEPDQALLIMDMLEHMLSSRSQESPDMEFFEESGRIVVPRIVEDVELNTFIQRETSSSIPYLQPFHQPNRRLKLDIKRAGALDTLYFKDDGETQLGEGEVEILVEATGMNFKDVVISMGQLASPYIGVECSGTVARVGSAVTSLAVGDRVCAMPVGAYRTFARCLATSAARIPDDMSMEIAASIPVAYCTAYYSLLELGRLERGERVLIHAGAGGVGQCAIQLAQMAGAEIFTTVGSVDKKRLIMERYGIPEDRIFYSRNSDFGPAVRAMTKGEGVDVVLNSLAGELLRETWDCIAHFGRFIEIGKRDITNNTRLEMRCFESNALFSSVDLTILAAERPRIMNRVMTCVMEALEQKKIGPMHPVTVMPISDVEKALRLLQGGKTTGKVVLTHGRHDQVKASHPYIDSIFSQNGSYIILGGTGGLGRSIAKWMVQKGAGSVILISRRGMNRDVEELIQSLGALGSAIHVRACDITHDASLQAVIRECSRSPRPVRGVIHATMVLRDMLYENMKFSDFDAVVQSKVTGAWNVHNSLLGEKLDFFVLFSSIAGIVGNKGQAAYAAANTFLDGLARHRRDLGLPGVAIDLPAMDDVGYLSQNAERRGIVLSTLKGNTATEAELHALLTAAIGGFPGWSPDPQILTGLNIQDSSRPPYAIHDARFANLAKAAPEADSTGVPQAVSVKQVVSTATCVKEAEKAVVLGLIEKLSAILLVSPEELDWESSVTACGLDSLNAIELRNWISSELLAHLQVLELLTSDTLIKLAALILQKSQIELSFRPEVV
ncbi:putative PKS-like protein biosynthetic cluster [Metarhizium rileyi]|uniref:Putative PKS-like protein biosynthetic cluster n=1 Tax=Metarhizium rileyi (strain RCEF 4871) TaxID=1649241 RepID=A0A5C6GH58_METRR|nr:putative PKS-like protein biosynthetic cluster [Metarhizium rileyi]